MLKKGKLETLCYVINVLRKSTWRGIEDFDPLICCYVLFYLFQQVLEVLEIGFKVEFQQYISSTVMGW